MQDIVTKKRSTRARPSEKPARLEIVLVTGSTGAIGSAIEARLAGRYRVIGLDRTCEGEPDCTEADLTSEQSLAAATGEIRKRYGKRIASVIHLAAYFDMTGEPNPLYDEVNVRRTERLLAALEGFEVEQFIYASTMLVHAPTEPGKPIDEAWPIEPKWPYPKSKVDAENVLRVKHRETPLVVFRIAGMYTDTCDSATLAQQIQRIHARALVSHVFPGNVSHGQAFVHLDDLCEAFARAIDRRKKLPADVTFLIGEPKALSYAELQREIARLIHGAKDWPTREIPKSLAKTGAWVQDKVEDVVPDAIDQAEEPFIKPFMVDLADDHFELDVSEARKALGWEPKRRLKTTLPKMIAALKADPPAWYAHHGLTSPARIEPEEHAELSAAEKKTLRQHVAHMEKMRRDTLWAHFTNIALGVWLIASPFALGYRDELGMAASDVASGALVALLALLSLSKRHGWAQWANVFVGIWLLFAPLVFWTASPAAYVNDTLVGTLVIALAILVPHMPGMSMIGMALGPDIPPGWQYSPSDWTQRLPIIVLALVGFFLARYMAAYQLGHIDAAWDPFFGRGTETIITSELSQAWPVPDAGLGALSYMLEALSGIMGDRRRWRTMPWMVAVFGFLIVPLGGVSIFFIIIQPIWIGTWCTLCLIAGAAMVIMIPYSLDEIVATAQFLKERWRSGKPLWSTFWHGDTMAGGKVERSSEFDLPTGAFLREMVSGGVDATWTLNACVLIGIGLMCTRLIFGTEGAMADSDHLVGSLVIVVAVSAWAEVARALRYVNVLFGAWLVIAPWILTGASLTAAIASVIAGLALIALSLPRGTIRNRYGEWDRWIV